MFAKLIEHNNWANRELIRACAALADEHLDARPFSGKQWSIREALVHLVEAQAGYLSLLTLPPEERTFPDVPWTELEESAERSGAGLLALEVGEDQVTSLDGYVVQPWVVMVQVVNHGNDHRRQVSENMRALDLTPPNLDGWSFGEAARGIRKIDPDSTS